MPESEGKAQKNTDSGSATLPEGLTKKTQDGPTVVPDGRARAVLQRAILESGVGLGVMAVEREVLQAMPKDFLFRYELLWLKAFGASVGGRSSRGEIEPNVVAGTKRVTRTSTGQTETRGGAHAGKKLAGASTKGVVSSDSALAMKRKVDSKIRKLSREIRDFLGGAIEGSRGRRCSSCKRYGDDEWLYCPWDRAPMEERD